MPEFYRLNAYFETHCREDLCAAKHKIGPADCVLPLSARQKSTSMLLRLGKVVADGYELINVQNSKPGQT